MLNSDDNPAHPGYIGSTPATGWAQHGAAKIRGDLCGLITLN